MLENNSIHGLNFENLLENLRVEIKVEEISEIKRIGRLDHLGPEIAMDSVLKALLHGEEPEPISFG